MAEAHRAAAGAGHTAHLDIGQVASTDATSDHPHDDVPRSGIGSGDIVDPDLSGSMYADL